MDHVHDIRNGKMVIRIVNKKSPLKVNEFRVKLEFIISLVL